MAIRFPRKTHELIPKTIKTKTMVDEERIVELESYYDKEIENLQENYSRLIDEMADLYEILLASGSLNDDTKKAIKERFYPKRK